MYNTIISKGKFWEVSRAWNVTVIIMIDRLDQALMLSVTGWPSMLRNWWAYTTRHQCFFYEVFFAVFSSQHTIYIVNFAEIGYHDAFNRFCLTHEVNAAFDFFWRNEKRAGTFAVVEGGSYRQASCLAVANCGVEPCEVIWEVARFPMQSHYRVGNSKDPETIWLSGASHP